MFGEDSWAYLLWGNSYGPGRFCETQTGQPVPQLPKLVELLPRFSTKWLETWSTVLVFELAVLIFRAESSAGGLRAQWPHVFPVPRNRAKTHVLGTGKL